MFLFKKVALAAGGLTLLSMFCFGRDAASYVGTSASWVKQSVRSSVPIDFEIDRARKMVKDIVSDVRKNMHVIAQEEVEVERLEKQIVASSATVDKERGELVRLKNDLGANLASYEYGGRTYTVAQVKTDLTNRFERFKTHEATLASLREIQQARRRSLEAARQKLEAMLVAKRQLEVDIENLEARLKVVEVAQTTSEFNFDDSRLGRVRELVSDLRTRLNVTEKLTHCDTDLRDEIPLSASASDDIAEQVAEYLEPDAAKVVRAASATRANNVTNGAAPSAK